MYNLQMHLPRYQAFTEPKAPSQQLADRLAEACGGSFTISTHAPVREESRRRTVNDVGFVVAGSTGRPLLALELYDRRGEDAKVKRMNLFKRKRILSLGVPLAVFYASDLPSSAVLSSLIARAQQDATGLIQSQRRQLQGEEEAHFGDDVQALMAQEQEFVLSLKSAATKAEPQAEAIPGVPWAKLFICLGIAVSAVIFVGQVKRMNTLRADVDTTYSRNEERIAVDTQQK